MLITFVASRVGSDLPKGESPKYHVSGRAPGKAPALLCLQMPFVLSSVVCSSVGIGYIETHFVALIFALVHRTALCYTYFWHGDEY